MTAVILDGKETAASVKTYLAHRVAVLAQAGIVPGLGTVPVDNSDCPLSLRERVGVRDC